MGSAGSKTTTEAVVVAPATTVKEKVSGTVTAVTLRIFGFWKSMPFSAVHRLLPLGVFGVIANIFTGMLMMQNSCR